MLGLSESEMFFYGGIALMAAAGILAALCMVILTCTGRRLKKKLDVKDERLNQKDEQIAMLKQEVEEWKARAVPVYETGTKRQAVNAGRIIPIHYGRTGVAK